MREPKQGSLWPIHPKPFNDEILSSWLSRAAEGHGLTLTQFLEQNLPRALGVGFDIDLVTDRRFLDTVALGTFSLATEVEKATFIPDEGTIFSDNDPLHLEWIVPLSNQQTSAGISRGKSLSNPSNPVIPSTVAAFVGFPFIRNCD